MEDKYGTPIYMGSIVAVVSPYSKNVYLGKVVRFMIKMIEIKYFTANFSVSHTNRLPNEVIVVDQLPKLPQ